MYSYTTIILYSTFNNYYDVTATLLYNFILSKVVSYDVSLLSDKWSSPVVIGQAPLSCDEFTLTTVGERRAAMFGGSIQSTLYCDHFYIVDLGRHSVVSV